MDVGREMCRIGRSMDTRSTQQRSKEEGREQDRGQRQGQTGRGGGESAHPWEALANNFFHPCQLCGLQRRMEAPNLKLVKLFIIQRPILQVSLV